MFAFKKTSIFQPLWDNYLRDEITDYLTVFLRLVYSGIFVLLLFAAADIPQKDFSWSGAVMAGILFGVVLYFPAEFPRLANHTAAEKTAWPSGTKTAAKINPPTSSVTAVLTIRHSGRTTQN